MIKTKLSPYSCPSIHNKELAPTEINIENIAISPNEFIYTYPAKNFSEIIGTIVKNHPEQACYFLNVGLLREKIRMIQSQFIPGNPHRVIAYAVKANPKPAILKILTDAGINNFDCASMGEIDLVKSVNPQANILYNNPVKPQKSIAAAYEQGVRHFTIQHRSEIAKILNYSDTFNLEELEIAVRLRASKGAAKIDFFEKYGASEEGTIKLINQIYNDLGAMPGISIHVGSQNNDPQAFRIAIKKMANVAKQAGGVKTFNIGGGIPVNYEISGSNLSKYLTVISAAVQKYVSGCLLNDGKIIIELGRAIIAEPVDLIVPIIGKETRGKKTLYFDDGIFTSFSDAIIHGWKYNFQVLNKEGIPKQGKLIPYMLFGRTCDAGDKLGEVLLPENINIGDYLWVPKAGAYMDSQSSSFNGFQTPTYFYYNF